MWKSIWVVRSQSPASTPKVSVCSIRNPRRFINPDSDGLAVLETHQEKQEWGSDNKIINEREVTTDTTEIRCS